jgi:hypothetical protein
VPENGNLSRVSAWPEKENPDQSAAKIDRHTTTTNGLPFFVTSVLTMRYTLFHGSL